jgi:hypothetical protein
MVFNQRKLADMIEGVRQEVGGRWTRRSSALTPYLEGVVREAIVKAVKQDPRAKTLQPPIEIPAELRPAKRMRRGLLR